VIKEEDIMSGLFRRIKNPFIKIGDVGRPADAAPIAG
jgi:hypothetical protein